MALHSGEMSQETSFLENDTTFFESDDMELNSSFSSKRIRTQRSFDACKIGGTLQNSPLFKAFENGCCFRGGYRTGLQKRLPIATALPINEVDRYKIMGNCPSTPFLTQP